MTTFRLRSLRGPRALIVLAAAALLPFTALKASAAPDQRAAISLDGSSWQTEIVAHPADPDTVPTDGWVSTAAPSTVYQLPDGGPHYAWYRRSLRIPANWTGRRIVLDFRGARFAPALFVDGALVGSQFNGFSPFRCDITGKVDAGHTYEIALRCQDLSALFAPGYTPGPGVSDRASLLAPAGGYKNFIGIWDHVRLESSPPQHIDMRTVAIATSTRLGTISVHGDAAAPPGAEIAVSVLSSGRPVLTLPTVKVGADGEWSAEAPFPHARFWSPYDPYLYTLGIALRSAAGAAEDAARIPFGFKEIWTSGPNIYLNGVKIHLLGSATWPLGEPESDAAIDAKVAAIRASNTIIFRLHNETWPEEWLNAADRDGLLIIDESPLYTDGDGMYAYNDPRFWANYRDQIRGMIERDRNHASLAMWSIENEELFMGNRKYDADLPVQLGDVGRYAKSLDPTHLITFEGDQDPDGAADVMGLHYPHEPPQHFAYPNTADWLSRRIVTQASGGLLGTRSTSFFWTRKKPLYIGEYLWMPQDDYSDGSIFYGDDAYLNLERYHALAQERAFTDQTLGYRRSGVSGMAPWTAFGFGGAIDNPALVADEKRFYTPVAAFPAGRGFRFFAGAPVRLRFDVFDDDMKPHDLTLELMRSGHTPALAAISFAMQPGGYRDASLAFDAPRVATRTAWRVRAILSEGSKPVFTAPLTLTFFPRVPLHAPPGTRLIVYDPSGRWPGSAPTLASLSSAAVRRTVLVVAPNAFGAVGGPVPTVGAGGGAGAIRSFLRRGGRALVLDQQTLAPLGLGLELVAHASTMTFPLRPNNPILKGLSAADLSDWAPDNYVTSMEIRRPTAYGARAVTVSGGPNELAQAPVVEAPYGKGFVIVMQALAAEKRSSDPAAAGLLQNAVASLAAMPAQTARPAEIVGGSETLDSALTKLGVSPAPEGSPAEHESLVLDGGGAPVLAAGPKIAAVLHSGGTVYWHDPQPAALDALRPVLGAGRIEEIVAERGTSLFDRDSPLLDGVAREDLTYQTVTTGWNASSRPNVHAASCIFLPGDPGPAMPIDLGAGASVLHIGSVGSAALPVTAPAAGLYRLTISASSPARFGDEPALLRVDVNHEQSSWIPVSGAISGAVDLVALARGKNILSLAVQNAGPAGSVTVSAVQLQLAGRYPRGADVLAMPGALVAWRYGGGLVVLDGTEWDTNAANIVRGERYASALLGDIGFSFSAPPAAGALQPIPLTAFALQGTSPYFSQTSDQITLLSDGTVAAHVRFERSGDYDLRVYGYSSACDGVYAFAAAAIDGAPIGTVEVKSETQQWFDIGRVAVPAGVHTLSVSFTNDKADATGDRNLYIEGIAVAGGP